jgi:hypothetical protein
MLILAISALVLSAVPAVAAAPRDAASGLPTGKRMHKPFTITAHVDAACPRHHRCHPRH